MVALEGRSQVRPTKTNADATGASGVPDDAMRNLSEVTPPKPYRVHPCRPLFVRLDAAADRPVTWIHGPPGAGKTTLAASYLAERGVDPLWYRLDGGPRNTANACASALPARCRPPSRKRIRIRSFTRPKANQRIGAANPYPIRNPAHATSRIDVHTARSLFARFI